MGRQEKPQSPDEGSALIAGVIQGAIRGCCLTLEVFLHGGFGRDYISSGGAGVLVLYCFIAFFPSDNQRPLFVFMAIYVLAWVTSMVAAWARGWRGRDQIHSRYNGQPRLQRFLSNISEETIKHCEAVTVFGVGLWVRRLNGPFGDYLLIASAIMLIRGLLMSASLRRQATEMNDMVVEQTVVAERFRKMQETRLSN